MGKHESLPDSLPQPKEKKGFKKYILPAALGLGALVAGKQVSQERPTEKPKVVEVKKEISFEALKDVFRAEVQVPGDRFILHIDQWHHKDGSIEKTERSPGGREVIIKSQKNVEKAIRFLMKEYEIRDFYLETVTADNQLLYNRLAQDIAGFKADIVANNAQRMLEYINFMEGVSAKMENDPEKSDLDRGQLNYFLLCRTKEVVAAAHEGRLKIEDADVEKLSTLATRLENDPHIADDTLYLWGSAFVLFARGEIMIHQVEDPASNARVSKLMDDMDAISPENKEAVASLEQQFLKAQNVREDGMIDFTSKYFERRPNHKLAPLILGASHYLHGNLRSKQEAGEARGIGLIKLHDIALDQFMEEVKKNPKYIVQQLQDEADLRYK